MPAVRHASEIILARTGINFAVAFAGFSGATRANSANAGAIFVGPKPFDERPNRASAPELIATLQRRLSEIQEVSIFVIPPPPVQGLGTSGGWKLLVQDRSGQGFRALQEATDAYVGAAQADHDVARVFSTFRASTPQLYADIDRVKSEKLGVPVANVFEALQVYLGSLYVNDFNRFGRTFQVRAQAEGASRAEPEDIVRIKTRNVSGGMVPLGSLVNLDFRSGSDRIVRYNMFASAEVNGDMAPGGSQGTAMSVMERLAARILPPGMQIAWTDIAYQAKLAGNTAVFVFPLSILFVFLVHSAEYESWSLPLAIILIAPMCLPFALLGTWLRGMDNNLITQIGFIVLIGLAAKNAVLIVEFAKQQQDEGKDRFAAAVEASRLRLRPILMTSFAFILGVLPLARATGPGAEMRQALGTAVFSGMLGVTILGLFLTPVFHAPLRGVSRAEVVVRRWAAVALAASVALAACAVGPGRRRRSRPAETRGQREPADVASLADLPWWEPFGTRPAPVTQAVAGSRHDLAVAAARVEETRNRIAVARADLFPQASYQGEAARTAAFESRNSPTRPSTAFSARSTSPGKSTCGVASAARPSRRVPSTWARRRRAAACS
jgi:multidrug efflux pump